MGVITNINDIQKLIFDSKKEKTELGRIIYPILEKYDLKKKEILEVCQIGKFIYKVDSGMLVIQKPQQPAPDFIIQCNNGLIGLEHTRILTGDADRYLRIVSLCDYAEEIYKSKHPESNVLAQFKSKTTN